MDSDVSQKNTDRLARIRENQRKCRARKQEHIRDLEQKMASLQDQVNRKDVEHRLAVQKLEAENRKLRYLLSCSGLSASTIQGYLQVADDPTVGQKVAIPALRKVETEPSSDCRQKGCPSSCQPRSERVDAMDVCREPSDQGVAGVPAARSPKPACKIATEPGKLTQSICDCAPTDMGTWSTDENVLNTTLCAIAEELISQYNTRGVEMEEIRRKLWAGFSKGLTTEEGCRVQNHILFQVLDEISNN
ncbi:hypothetical protein BDV59DRAFT_198989 [Aspergillus ambiguus]|uniref:bZIP transcription factor n=1 Tax=Aspergillus ambiguus TaxID=176160 RepID=UPI003CCDD393